MTLAISALWTGLSCRSMGWCVASTCAWALDGWSSAPCILQSYSAFNFTSGVSSSWECLKKPCFTLVRRSLIVSQYSDMDLGYVCSNFLNNTCILEFQSINSTGSSTKGLIFAAELVSCAKRTMARMLVSVSRWFSLNVVVTRTEFETAPSDIFSRSS